MLTSVGQELGRKRAHARQKKLNREIITNTAKLLKTKRRWWVAETLTTKEVGGEKKGGGVPEPRGPATPGKLEPWTTHSSCWTQS
jgi:hypothetical protein